LPFSFYFKWNSFIHSSDYHISSACFCLLNDFQLLLYWPELQQCTYALYLYTGS
jgi:hypothetical protein